MNAGLEPEGALIEFSGRGDTETWVRKHVLHYKVDADKVERIEPIALSPRDFVEEWLTRPWAEIAEWSEPQLAEWHTKLHKDYVSGEFDAVQRCTKPGEWQISIAFADKISYFSVLDRGDYRYRMLRVSTDSRPECSGENELGHEGPVPTLFPKK